MKLISGLTYVGTHEPDIEFTPLLDDPFVLACPRSHPLAKRKAVAWAELANLDYLAIAQGSGNRAVIDEALAGVAERPKWFCEVRHVPALVSLIEAGLGMGVVPRLAMPRGPHKVLASVALTDPPIRRTLGVLPASRTRLVFRRTLLPPVADGDARIRCVAIASRLSGSLNRFVHTTHQLHGNMRLSRGSPFPDHLQKGSAVCRSHLIRTAF